MAAEPVMMMNEMGHLFFHIRSFLPEYPEMLHPSGPSRKARELGPNSRMQS